MTLAPPAPGQGYHRVRWQCEAWLEEDAAYVRTDPVEFDRIPEEEADEAFRRAARRKLQRELARWGMDPTLAPRMVEHDRARDFATDRLIAVVYRLDLTDEAER